MAESPDNPCRTSPAPTSRRRSSSAERVRRHRAFSRDGVRFATIRITPEIEDVLIRGGYLDRNRADDRHNLGPAVEECLDALVAIDIATET